jgi:hypothetical protein
MRPDLCLKADYETRVLTLRVRIGPGFNEALRIKGEGYFQVAFLESIGRF